MIAATIQFKGQYGLPKVNMGSLILLCEKAVNCDARVIILPEMCLTGYIWTDREAIYSLSETSTGESFQAFSDFCRNNKCYVAYGYAEKDTARNLLFNSQNLIGPDGELLATYRKTHLFQLDQYWAHPGDSGFIHVDTGFGRMGMGICMDLNYNDFIDYHINNKTEWLLFSTNWLEEGVNVHEYWRFRFGEFMSTAFIANTYGFEFGIQFCGQSSVYERGRFIEKGPKESNSIIITGHA